MGQSRNLLSGLIPALALLVAGLAAVAPEAPPISPTERAPSGSPLDLATLATPPAGTSERARRILESGPLRGIALGLFSQDPRYDYVTLLEEIQGTGAPWVSLTCNYYQPRNDSAALPVPDPRSPPEARIVRTIRIARALGLRVMLFPILLIQDPGEDNWRGTIAPRDRAEWYRRYRTLMVDIAELAEREGVELLSIGSELNSMQSDTQDWRAIIRAVRAVYSGAVTYSVNWDTLGEPAFLDDLDFVGMTTYFSLTGKNDPTVDELVAAWGPIHEDILTWQAHMGLPLLFTEVGFPSLDGANRNPWNYYISAKVDVGEQRDCYDAFTRVWGQEKNLAGVFFYNWFGVGGRRDTGYTPRGKPALKVLRRWFRRAPEASPHPKDGDRP